MTYYDKQGKEIKETAEWTRLFGDKDYKTIGHDTIGKYRVSTVWLGLDHQFGEGKPLIFETMVFGGNNEMQKRYATEEEAQDGHFKTVEIVIKKVRKVALIRLVSFGLLIIAVQAVLDLLFPRFMALILLPAVVAHYFNFRINIIRNSYGKK